MGISRATYVWLGLVLATLASLYVGDGLSIDGGYAAAAVLIIAFVKVRLVIFEFMEVRDAPRTMRFAVDVWAIIACAVLIVLFWMSVG